MTGSEILYVLQFVRECVLKRQEGSCTHQCEGCTGHINFSSVLQMTDSIIGLVEKNKR